MLMKVEPLHDAITDISSRGDVRPCVVFFTPCGVAFTQHVWMNQGFQDELAEAAGRDPVELYMELLDETTVPFDLKDRDIAVGRIRNMRDVLTRAARIARWPSMP